MFPTLNASVSTSTPTESELLGGGNTRINVLDDHVFYNQQAVDGFSTVSIPQLILDLLAEGGPCEKAAMKLIDSYHGDDQNTDSTSA